MYLIAYFIISTNFNFILANCYFDSMKWNGSITYTSAGRKCQQWVKDYPHKHDYHINSRYPEGSQSGANSYCRDPDGDGTPWCYTLDPDVRWDYCGIPQCASRFQQVFPNSY